MNDKAQVDERDTTSLLDAFAQSAAAPPALMQPAALPAPTDRVFGAQQVAVHRDEVKILQKIRALAAAAGENWYYRYPVKNKKTNRTDWVEGPSIKLANDIARLYGNNEVDCRVFDMGDSLVFYARFSDLETGYTLTRPFQQRKSQKTMDTDNARAADIVFQIGASKAIRNVVVNGLQTFADFAFDEAKGALIGKIGQNLAGWRDRAVQRLKELGVDLKRAELMVGRAAKDWLAPDVARVVAEIQAVRDGMATADETWPPIEAGAETETKPKTETKPRTAKGKKDEPAKAAPVTETKAPEEGATDKASGASEPEKESVAGEQATKAESVADLSTAETRAPKWPAFHKKISERLVAAKTSDQLDELRDYIADDLREYQEFDPEGRKRLGREIEAAYKRVRGE